MNEDRRMRSDALLMDHRARQTAALRMLFDKENWTSHVFSDEELENIIDAVERPEIYLGD